MKPSYSILLSVVLNLACLSFTKAQDIDSVKTQAWAGIRLRPFATIKSSTAGLEYIIQGSKVLKHIHPVLKFGYTTYQEHIPSPHQVSYKIDARYIKPGISFFMPSDGTNNFMYVSASVSFCRMHHDLVILIDDPNWGKSEYPFTADMTITSMEVEVGGIFQIQKRLYGTGGFTIAPKMGNTNPFPQIDEFDYSEFTPGAGFGGNLAVDVFIGMLILIN